MSDDIYRKVDPEQPVPWWLVPVEEPLLTRSEAANDPEVIRMVMVAHDGLSAALEVTDEMGGFVVDDAESRVSPRNQHTSWVTDPPDPDCPRCKGRGVVGGCGKAGCDHFHTFSFCRCVNERRVEINGPNQSHA